MFPNIALAQERSFRDINVKKEEQTLQPSPPKENSFRRLSSSGSRPVGNVRISRMQSNEEQPPQPSASLATVGASNANDAESESNGRSSGAGRISRLRRVVSHDEPTDQSHPAIYSSTKGSLMSIGTVNTQTNDNDADGGATSSEK